MKNNHIDTSHMHPHMHPNENYQLITINQNFKE